MRSERIGVVLILVQQFLFTLDTAAIHSLAGSVSLWQLGLLRSIGGLVLALCLAPSAGRSVFRTHHPVLQLLRARSPSVTYGCWYTPSPPCHSRTLRLSVILRRFMLCFWRRWFWER